ncbi:MAG: glycosyltransferase [Melioribacteraceae bacterium]|nr:glycosyltransferase [Melioribacteraceae bacterium]
MNILFISSQPYPYGMAASKRIRLFAEYLAVNNNVNVIIAGKNNDRNKENGIKNRVKWEFIKFNRLQIIFGWLKKKKILKGNFNRNSQNILILYDGIGLTNVLFAIIGRNLGYSIFVDIVENYLVHEENTSIRLSFLHKINVIFDKNIKYFVTGLIVISKRIYEKYTNLGLKESQLELIPISAENLLFEFNKNNNSEKIKFVYSGTYGIKDGVNILVEAFNKVSKIYFNTELILAGQINFSTKNIIQGNPKIKYIGMVPDEHYYQFLKNADVLLMTRINSTYANAGFPFKLGEYLGTGNPVIATDVSDVKFYLENLRDVILANPSDELSLINSMRFVIENKEEAARIGENGYKKCMTYFHPATNGEKIELFLKSF